VRELGRVRSAPQAQPSTEQSGFVVVFSLVEPSCRGRFRAILLNRRAGGRN
jgi:hypothetical protein